MQNIGNLLFVIAGVLWAIELIPQLIKTIRTKSVGDISLFFITLCFTAFLIFITGCVLIKNWFLVISHILPFVNVCILLILVLKYKKRQHFPSDSRCHTAYIIKNKIKFCPSFCLYLNPTEEDQSHLKEPHFCSKYNKRLFHQGYHPNIVCCKECREKK